MDPTATSINVAQALRRSEIGLRRILRHTVRDSHGPQISDARRTALRKVRDTPVDAQFGESSRLRWFGHGPGVDRQTRVVCPVDERLVTEIHCRMERHTVEFPGSVDRPAGLEDEPRFRERLDRVEGLGVERRDDDLASGLDFGDECLELFADALFQLGVEDDTLRDGIEHFGGCGDARIRPFDGERSEFVDGVVGHRARPVGRPVDGVVVTDDEFAGATAPDIDLDAVDAEIAVSVGVAVVTVRPAGVADRVADSRERVLGIHAGEPAVCDAVHARRFTPTRESPLPVATLHSGMPVDFDFGDSVVLVTGAGGALGSAVCEAFDAAGATVCGADIVSPDDDDFLLDTDVAHFYQGDFTDENDVAETVEAVVDDHGGLDALVNVAGTWRGGEPIDETDVDTFDFLMDVNLKTMFLASKHAIPHLGESHSESDDGDGSDDGAEQGAVVSISARSSLEGGEGDGIYRSTKAGVRILTETIAEENLGEVRANAVMPSVIDTPMNREMMDYDESWVDPADIAEVILFLCSDAASVTSGAAVPVYGEA